MTRKNLLAVIIQISYNERSNETRKDQLCWGSQRLSEGEKYVKDVDRYQNDDFYAGTRR